MENERCRALFSDDNCKAAAFDEIAKVYYHGNFGTMQKSDFDVLMFSIYVDRIIETTGSDIYSICSDYKLSKELGITQSRVENLKVRKQLRYHREHDWKDAFNKACENAIYDNKKIMIPIPDKNLYYEVKNAIEEKGGYIETQLNSKLLQISPKAYLSLMLHLSGDSKEEMEKKIRETIRENNKDADFIDVIDKEPVSKLLANTALNTGIDVISDIIEICVPVAGRYIAKAIREATPKIIKSLK